MHADKEEPRSSYSLAAIIIAAGYSSRMHSFKPLLPLGASTVIENAVHSFQNAGISDIRVVIGHRGQELAPVLDGLGVASIVNHNFAQGMFTSIVAGLQSLTPETIGFFLLPVDNPIIRQDTIQRLTEAFVTMQLGIAYPSYQGMRGHPPLISTRYVSTVLAWKNPGGMRAILKQQDHAALDVDVADPGVLMDMDTPEDYQSMLEYVGSCQLPSEQECKALLASAKTPDKVIRHCRQVAGLSCLIGSYLNNAGCAINLDLLRMAALLHDVAKGRPDHPGEGARMLAQYPQVARIIAEHMDINLNFERPITEKEIVYLADKLVTGTQLIPLKDRFAKKLEKYKHDRNVLGSVKTRLSNAESIQARIEKIINLPLQKLWKTELGGEPNG